MAKTLAPAKNADEIREQLTDRAVMKDILADPEKLNSWINESVQARLKDDPELLAQVDEQAEDFRIKLIRDLMQHNGELDVAARRLNLDNPNGRGRIRNRRLYNKDAIGAEHDGLFNDPAEFLHAISDHSHKDDALSSKLGALKNAMSSIKPSDGGFLIPEVLRAELLRIGLEQSVVRSRARVIPMDSLTVPFPTVDSTSNVSSVYGGIVGYWTEEGATLTESKPKFGRIELKANKLVLYTEVPNELLQDSQPSLEAFIGEIFPEALAWYEDIAFFIGGGVGEPLGFMNAGATVSVTRSTTVAGTNVEWVDIASMYARMLPQSLNRAVWIVSPDVMPSLLTSQIPGGAPIIVQGGDTPNGASAPAMTILGRPVIVSEKARAVGTVGDISFVDFGYYLIGDRQAMSARQSEDFRFNQDVTAFRVIERLDGRPWLTSAITPRNGGNTLSPFVNLTTSV
jgi:HK97 family phage major capsid protein